jgi:hypothetical protein
MTPCGTDTGVWKDYERVVMEFSFSFAKNEVEAVCRVDNLDAGEFSVILQRITTLCRTTTDIVSFAQGRAVQLVLHTVVWTDGRVWPIEKFDPNMAKAVTVIEPGGSLASVKAILASEPKLMIALNDLIDGFNGQSHGPTHCARSVEGIRNLIAGSGAPSAKWKVMRERLRLTEEYVSFVTDLSVAPRHGDHQFIDAARVREAGIRAWVVMNRYLEYRKRGSQLLPLDLFPVL